MLAEWQSGILTKTEFVRNVSVGLTDSVQELSREPREPEFVQLAGRRDSSTIAVRGGTQRSLSAQSWNIRLSDLENYKLKYLEKLKFPHSLLPITS